MDTLRNKSIKLTGFAETLTKGIGGDRLSIITPADPEQRGCQLSLSVKSGGKSLYEQLVERGIYCDWREPNVIRVAPTPLYNSFQDVYRFFEILRDCLM